MYFYTESGRLSETSASEETDFSFSHVVKPRCHAEGYMGTGIKVAILYILLSNLESKVDCLAIHSGFHQCRADSLVSGYTFDLSPM